MENGVRKRGMENLLEIALLIDSTAEYQVQHEGDSKKLWTYPLLLTEKRIQEIINNETIVNVQIIINLIQKKDG